MAYMVRVILKVATGLDAKLCDYYKVKTPAAGQKVVQKHIDKGSKGLNSLSAALRIPSAGKAEKDPEPTAENVSATAQEWWEECKKLAHSDKYGMTNTEIRYFIETLYMEMTGKLPTQTQTSQALPSWWGFFLPVRSPRSPSRDVLILPYTPPKPCLVALTGPYRASHLTWPLCFEIIYVVGSYVLLLYKTQTHLRKC